MSRTIHITPRVTLPRFPVAGRRYLVSVDLEHDASPEAWPYEREEYAVTCLLNTLPLFDQEPLDDSTVILHRFGGTYGEVRFLLTASQTPRHGTVRLELMGETGAPLGTMVLPEIRVVAADDDRRTTGTPTSIGPATGGVDHPPGHRGRHTPMRPDPIPGRGVAHRVSAGPRRDAVHSGGRADGRHTSFDGRDDDQERLLNALALDASPMSGQSDIDSLTPNETKPLIGDSTTNRRTRDNGLTAMNAPLNLLVIEDDPKDFLLLTEKLGEQGVAAACTRVASNPELEAALDRGPWDAVLAEYSLSGMDFEATLEMIRRRRPDLPIILVFGTLGEAGEVELLRFGVWDFITKDNVLRLPFAIERCRREVAGQRAREAAEEELRQTRERLRETEERLRQTEELLRQATDTALRQREERLAPVRYRREHPSNPYREQERPRTHHQVDQYGSSAMNELFDRSLEKRLQLAMEANRSFAFEWEPDSDLVWCSVSSRMIFGRVGELAGELADGDTGQGCFRRLTLDDRKRFVAWAQRLQPGANSDHDYAEYYLACGDGQTMIMDEAVRAVFDANEQLHRLIGMTTDITGRRRAGRLAQARYQRLVEANVVGVAIGEASGNILEANVYYLNLLGYTRDDLGAGKVNWRDATPPHWLPRYDESLAELSARGGCTPYEKEYQRQDGSLVPVWIAHVLLPDTEGQGRILSLAVDFSERKRLETELHELAGTDPLTGALNRRCMLEAMENEARRAKRHGWPLALIMLDIDHFKKINDTYGHDQGDEVLKAIVAQLKQRLRGSDIVARWSGAEIMLLLPETPLDRAALLAETLRAGLHSLSRLGVGSVTASFGVAEYRPMETLEQWLKCVDDLVYRAKREGRDRVAFRAT